MKTKEYRPDLLAVGALIVSMVATGIAWQARSDVRAIEQLDLEPRISFSASLLRDEYISDRKLYGSSSFTIANFGPVDAIQVNVEFIDVCFNINTKKVTSYSRKSKLKTIVGTLQPYERKPFELPQDAVNALAECHDKPPNDAAVLAWISYKREHDRKTFITRALYFVSKDGLLLSDSMRYADEQGNPSMHPAYYDTYSDIIIDYADSLELSLEEDEWHAIYPLDIQKRSETIYQRRL